jgi:hypothetical protein
MSAPHTRIPGTAWLRAALAGLALVAACSGGSQRSDAGPDCTGLAVPTIACLVGPTVPVCVLENGHPTWTVTCPGENTGGTGGGGGAGGNGGTGATSDGGVGEICVSTSDCPSGLTCTTEDGVCNSPPGCTGPASCPAVCTGTCRAPTAPPVTFSLDNGGTTSLFIFESCIPDLTITQLTSPPVVIGQPSGGCGICSCAQVNSCPPVTCGPCFEGGLEIIAAGAQQYFWSPVDLSYETRGSAQCSHTRVLPPGQYRIDVPVYTTSAGAVAKTGGWVVSRTFDLPTTDTIHVPLAPTTP